MGPLLDDLAVVENGDLVAELARGETVADVNRCPVAGNLVEFLIDFCLCNGVKGRSWLIQNDERGILIGTCFCLSWLLLHLINQSKYSSLLILGQP